MIRSVLLIAALGVAVPQAAGASGSGPAPRSAPAPEPTATDIYNEGVPLMRAKKFKRAQRKFEAALREDEQLAEAHNNLAYCLRKQGEKKYAQALEHYNRAIELKKDMPEPYMYRGVLFVQMGQRDAAEKDLERLVALDSDLADELRWVLDNGREKEPEQFFGVSRAL